MSYLLETLKRLEQKRNRQGASDLLLIQGEATQEQKKRTVWPYVLSAALLANAAAVLWWTAPWHTERTVSSRTPAVKETERPSRTVSAQTAPKNREEAPPAYSGADRDAKKAPSNSTPSQSSASDQIKKIEREPARPQPPTARQPGQADRSQPSPVSQAAAEKKPALSGKVFDVQDLPPAVQAGIPQMKISVHSYDPDRSSRLVRINDRTLKEGEFLTPEVRVEEITQTGMILSFQGYLFRVVLDHTR